MGPDFRDGHFCPHGLRQAAEEGLPQGDGEGPEEAMLEESHALH